MAPWMLSLKVVALSAALLFTALGVKASLPLLTTHLPTLWNLCLLCFKPPFIYILLNAIIISIVASSKFFHHNVNPFDTPQPPLLHLNPPLSKTPQQQEDQVEKAIDIGVVEDSALIPLKSIDKEIPPEYLISPMEKPLVSARFGHRKPPKSIPEGGSGSSTGKSLRVVARAKRHDTLENTWKAITEGRAIPLSRHVRKCDTWQNRGSAAEQESRQVNKCETFKEQRSNHSRALALRREPSLSQEELNRRVEAFIRNFNQQMRLQRQQSLEEHYKHMLNPTAD
ncbi:hypothetical protein PIB30_019666 [Stylosanthes scabra]|uniref:DUF4408 domain-containing protein n=1 Tax=Stylosanthes scabra TaxID=79078 RepID=A0ABU6T853_9FABA|nr:hypothetical protein [Stylosanthes scabra]